MQLELPDRPARFENPSEDDFHFQNPVSIDQLTSFLQNPARWIAELNKLKNPGDPDVEIRDDFVLRLQLRNKPTTMMGDGKACLIQGINGTNIVTVRPRRSLMPMVGVNWDNYWLNWQANGDLRVVVNTDFNQGYGHMELSDPMDSAQVRADKIAAFLILGSDPTKALAGVGPYLNAILGKTPSVLTTVTGNSSSQSTPTGRLFKLVEPEDVLNIDFTLTANLSELSSMEIGPPPPVACDNMAGTWDGTEITLDDVIVKDYA